MRIEVLAFARAREFLGCGSLAIDLPASARIADAWSALETREPRLRELASSIRLARNARMADLDEVLAEGDTLALLPPVGGG